MQKAIPAIVAISFLFLASCTAFRSPRTSLGTLQDAAIAARMTMRPVIDGYCEDAKRRCAESNRLTNALFTVGASDCPEYDTCHQVRMIIIRTLEAVQFAIADANVALALGDETRYEKAVERATQLLIDVQRQMQILGIIPGEEDGGREKTE